MLKLLIIIILSVNFVSASMVEKSFIYDDVKRSYLEFIPSNHNIKAPINLVIGLHGYSGSASGFEKETTGMFNKSAEKYKFLAIYPQGEYFYNDANKDYPFISSWNAFPNIKPNKEFCSLDAVIYPKYPNCKNPNRCSWTSCIDDLGFIKKIIDISKENYLIDKVFVIGMSNGGMMAQALACKYPNLFSGVINVVGMQPLGASCIPEIPVNFVIYGGALDRVTPPINIQSYDGYFYEPMDKTFNSWSNKFKCKFNELNKIDTHNNITKKVSYGCNGNIKIISLLNDDAGHTWPGINNSDRGYCHTGAQNNIISPDCKIEVNNVWGNDLLLDILFNL